MLYIINNWGFDKPGKTVQTIEWKLGDKLTRDDIPGEIVEIKADGREQDFILLHVEGIPVGSQRRSTSWFGDHAKFIFYNLIAD